MKKEGNIYIQDNELKQEIIRLENNALRKAVRDINAGIGLSKSYDDVDEMFKDLES